MEHVHELNKVTRSEARKALGMSITLRPPGPDWGEPEYHLIRDTESASLAAAASWKHRIEDYVVRCAVTVRTPRLGNGFERCLPSTGVCALAWMYSAWTRDPGIKASSFLPRLGSGGMWTCRSDAPDQCRRNEVLTYTSQQGMRLQAYSLGQDRHVVVSLPSSSPFLGWQESRF